MIKYIASGSKKYNTIFYLVDTVFGKAVFLNRDSKKIYFKIEMNADDYFYKMEEKCELDIILRCEIDNGNMSRIFCGFRLIMENEMPDSTEEVPLKINKNNYLSRRAISKRWNEAYAHDDGKSIGEILACTKKEEASRQAKLKTFKEEIEMNIDDSLEIKITCADKGEDILPTLLKEISDRIQQYNCNASNLLKNHNNSLYLKYKYKLNIQNNGKTLKEGN